MAVIPINSRWRLHPISRSQGQSIAASTQEDEMHPMLRNVLAVVAGLVIGSIVNMGLINISAHAIPPPAGADLTTTEGLKAAMHFFEPKHFLFPFMAHALGTLVGAAATAYLAASREFHLAMIVCVVFLAGGISMVLMLPSPIWFDVLDLAGAYLPMAWIGWKLGARNVRRDGAPAVKRI